MGTVELVDELRQRYEGLVAFCTARVLEALADTPFAPDDEEEGTSGWDRTEAVVKELVMLSVRFNTDHSSSVLIDQYATRLQRQAERVLRENEWRGNDKEWGDALLWLAYHLFIGSVMCAVDEKHRGDKDWSDESWFGI